MAFLADFFVAVAFLVMETGVLGAGSALGLPLVTDFCDLGVAFVRAADVPLAGAGVAGGLESCCPLLNLPEANNLGSLAAALRVMRGDIFLG